MLWGASPIVDPAGLKVTTKNFYDLGGQLTGVLMRRGSRRHMSMTP